MVGCEGSSDAFPDEEVPGIQGFNAFAKEPTCPETNPEVVVFGFSKGGFWVEVKFLWVGGPRLGPGCRFVRTFEPLPQKSFAKRISQF